MGDSPETFFDKLLGEIEASEKSMNSVFELGKKGTPITVDLIEKEEEPNKNLQKLSSDS